MPYSIILKKEPGLLRFYVSGKRNFADSYQLWEQIYKECEHHQIYKVHATITLSGRLQVMDIPLFIREVIKLNNQTPITCAWVDHNHQSYRDNQLGAKIPRPQSMNIKIFDNDYEAEQWLASQ